MVYRPDVKRDLCFVLIPFHQPFLDYYEGIIKPAAEAVGLKVEKSDEIYGTGSIIHDIWSRIWQAVVVVADVTGKNPNVNYELGLCHSLGVPTVLITQNIDDVPFDYRHRRCIPYDTEKLKWEENLRQAISQTIQKALSGEERGDDLRWPYETSAFREPRKVGSFDSSDEVMDDVIEGAGLVAASVARALGPHGIQVSLRVGKADEITVTGGAAIAFATSSSDPRRMAGIVRMQRVAAEMRDAVGDGSKLAVLLCQELLKSGRKAVKQGHVLRDVIYGMDAAVENALEQVDGSSKAVSGENLISIGRTAAGGDGAIARVVLDAFRKVGKDGLVYVEEWNGDGIELDVQEGMYFDRGYLTPDFVTDEKHGLSLLKDPFVFICDYKLSSMRELLPLLEQVAKSGRQLLLIAEDVEGEALSTLIVNKKRGTLFCVPVRAPGFGDRRLAMLEDIAILTGGTLLTRSAGYLLQNIQLSQLGRANEITVTKDGTTIVGGAGSLEAVKARVESIRNQVNNTSDGVSRERLMERLAKLASGAAVIRVGGINRQEIIETKQKVISAMHSCRAAIEDGLVAGGGLVLFKVADGVQALQFSDTAQGAGRDAVVEALKRPLRQQIENARGNAEQSIRDISGSNSATVGFNAYTRKVEDLFSAGVVDPTKMVRLSLRTAFTHARVILQTGAWAFGTEDEMGPIVPTADVS